MKKVIIVLLVSLIIMLTACSNDNEPKNEYNFENFETVNVYD